MKKFFYILLFSLVSSAFIVSCTKEEVKPIAGGTGAATGIKE
jgi:hypothetical protein